MAAEDYFDLMPALDGDAQNDYDLEKTMEKRESLKPENVKCPECNGPMASRSGKFGKFWGCKAYPDCRGTRDVNGDSKADRAKEFGRTDHNDLGPDSYKPVSSNRVSFNKKVPVDCGEKV